MGSVEMLSHLTEEKKEEVKRILDDEVTKSGKIRALYAAGLEVKDISHILDVRYNFAYNVVAQQIKDGLVEAHPASTTQVTNPQTTVVTPVEVATTQAEVIKETPQVTETTTDISTGAKEELGVMVTTLKTLRTKLVEIIDMLDGKPANKSM